MIPINLSLPEGELAKIKVAMLESATDAFKQASKQHNYGPYLSLGEAAQYVGISRASLTKLISEGLSVIQVTGSIQRISKQTLDKFLKDKEI